MHLVRIYRGWLSATIKQISLLYYQFQLVSCPILCPATLSATSRVEQHTQQPGVPLVCNSNVILCLLRVHVNIIGSPLFKPYLLTQLSCSDNHVMYILSSNREPDPEAGQ